MEKCHKSVLCYNCRINGAWHIGIWKCANNFFLVAVWFSVTRWDVTDSKDWKDFCCLCVSCTVVTSHSAFNHGGEPFCDEMSTSEQNHSLLYTMKSKKNCFSVLLLKIYQVFAKHTFNHQISKGNITFLLPKRVIISILNIKRGPAGLYKTIRKHSKDKRHFTFHLNIVNAIMGE